MEKIKQFFEKKAKQTDDLPRLIRSGFAKEIPKHFRLMETLNREQLFSGIRADNTEIKPEYTDFTKSIKLSKSQPIDRVTLKDTGAFYSSIRANVINNSVIIKATDSKTQKLELKYKPEIIGLTEKNRKRVGNMLFIGILDYLRKNFLKP